MNPLVDKALQAHQQAENLRQEAISALLLERKTIADQLRALGHVEGQKPAKQAPAANPEKVCPVCKEKGHDGRFHRRKAAPPPPKPEKTAPPPKPPTPPK